MRVASSKVKGSYSQKVKWKKHVWCERERGDVALHWIEGCVCVYKRKGNEWGREAIKASLQTIKQFGLVRCWWSLRMLDILHTWHTGLLLSSMHMYRHFRERTWEREHERERERGLLLLSHKANIRSLLLWAYIWHRLDLVPIEFGY